MGDSEDLSISLRAKNDTDAAFRKAGENVVGLQGKAKGLTTAFNSLAKGVSNNLGAISSAVASLAVVGQVYDQVVNKTVDFARSVDDMSQLTGDSVSNASKLILVAERLGIGVETLTSGLETAVSKGFSPNIEGLREMADQYVALETPIAKSFFMIQRFGKSAGPELADLLEDGSAGVDKMLESVSTLNQIMTEDSIRETKEYARSLRELKQANDSFSMAVGKEAVPILTKSAIAGEQILTGSEKLLRVYGQHQAEVIKTSKSYQDYVKESERAYLEIVKYAGGVFMATGAIGAYTNYVPVLKHGVNLITEAEYDHMKAMYAVAAAYREAGTYAEHYGQVVVMGQHHKNASETNPNVGRRNLYTGEVTQTPDSGWGRASGGPMWAGVGRWVGENGPEWMEPSSGGWISDKPPASAGATFGDVHFHIQSSEPKAVRREIEQVLRDMQAVGRL